MSCRQQYKTINIVGNLNIWESFFITGKICKKWYMTVVSMSDNMENVMYHQISATDIT